MKILRVAKKVHFLGEKTRGLFHLYIYTSWMLMDYNFSMFNMQWYVLEQKWSVANGVDKCDDLVR